MSLLATIKRKIHNATHPQLGVVLMLHRVVEERSMDSSRRELEITPQFLEQTIKDYRDKGYCFVSIDEVCGILEKGRGRKPFICLTFDDGYFDTYDVAYPILKKYGVPFAVYITTGFVDQTAKIWWYDNVDAMIWEQITILDKDPLCTIGAHTVTHSRLSTLPELEANKEIVDSKHRLEERLGHAIDHFSYPHGDYNTNTVQIVKEAGFISSLKAWGGKVRKGDATLLELPRIELREQ